MRTAYDPFIVESVMHGFPPPPDMSVAERREIVHRLRQSGLTNKAVADRLGVTRQSVEQDVARWRPQRADIALAVAGQVYPAERFDGESIAHAAGRIIARVHDECADSVWTELTTMPDMDVRALCVTLAACCDPNKSIREMLAWTDELAPTG
ncbi:helix-turn-helix domain-containing protein [Gordonia sp. PDNC005]|uniref:helix-turn-helix domain-containing protein n=1 Tax=Gordonia sp. PDNC005 TaxID=2811424 RepID=UPI00196691E7|nr:helix-turn-helix domain-containing protein [Gordonia sp. PDNC005]QRY62712.1 helix-turn-helix domain-containing protein [Gordonia sp. PDNC005]